MFHHKSECLRSEGDWMCSAECSRERRIAADAVRHCYELIQRRVFKWGGYPPSMDEPDETRRNARRDEASAIEHELRALAGNIRSA